MKYVAQPHPLNAEPFIVREHGHCKYPWCKYAEFLDGDRDKAVHALVLNPANIPITGNMHVRHTTLAGKYDGGRTEYHEDDRLSAAELHRTEAQARPASSKLVEEVVNSVPTITEYVTNVEILLKDLKEGEVLIITPAARTARRVRVNVWRRML